MEMKKEKKYDTTRTVRNLQKFFQKPEKQKMEMKKENKYDTTRTVRNLPGFLPDFPN